MSASKSSKITTSDHETLPLKFNKLQLEEKPQLRADATYFSRRKVAPWIFDNTGEENRSLGEAEGRSPEEPLDEIRVWSAPSIMLPNEK